MYLNFLKFTTYWWLCDYDSHTVYHKQLTIYQWNPKIHNFTFHNSKVTSLQLQCKLGYTFGCHASLISQSSIINQFNIVFHED